MLPGGGASAKQLSTNRMSIEFVKNFMIAAQPVAAIGEGSG
jgi:putative intracellular protease/amidase